MRKNDLKVIKNKFRDFEKNIKTLKRFEYELNSLDIKGFEPEVETIRSKLKSPDKITEIEKEIVELKDKITERVPDLSVNRSPSKTSITEGEELDVKTELKNDGKEVAKFVSFSDSSTESFKIISGDNYWTGDLKPGESKFLTYTLKADKTGKYTIPHSIVKYEDKRGNNYEQSAEVIEIEVKGKNPQIKEDIAEVEPPVVKEGTREKHIFKLEIESPDTIEIASDKADQGVYSVRFITPHYSSRPKSADVGKDLLEYINASINAVTEAMNKVRGVRGDEEEKIEEYSREMLGSLRDLGCILYKQILPPDIMGELSKLQQIKHLELSISENLGEYPWEAMHDDTDIDSFLCLKYALGRTIQVEGTIESPTGIIGDKLKALVIGDPLEGCERELPMAKKKRQK